MRFILCDDRQIIYIFHNLFSGAISAKCLIWQVNVIIQIFILILGNPASLDVSAPKISYSVMPLSFYGISDFTNFS